MVPLTGAEAPQRGRSATRRFPLASSRPGARGSKRRGLVFQCETTCAAQESRFMFSELEPVY